MFLKKAANLFFSLFVLITHLKGQEETVITGRVTESTTNRGIPFVNIFFKGTVVGTITNFEGNFIIKTTKPKDSIYVSLIGYQSKAKAVKKGLTQTINFQLSPEALNLAIIVVSPGVNPAVRIIQNAINNKSKYNRENLESVQYVGYTKQETDINNISAKMRKRKFLHGLTAMWDKLDTLAGENAKANLPVAMSEIISEIYSYKEGNKKREDVKAVKIKFVGMKDGSAVSQLAGTEFENYNFCNNNVAIVGKDFLSPIADNAILFYDYFLIDSLFIDQFKCYKINCHPKNKKDPAYTGTVWITDSTYAIKQLNLEITKDVNFNLVDHARIQQVMVPTEAGPWVPMQTRVMIDFATQLKKLISVVQHTYNYNKYFVVNKPKEKNFYNTRITYSEDAITKDSSYWIKERPEALTSLEAQSYNMIDTVRHIPFIKNGVNVMYFLITGYKDIGPIDFGHYLQTYAFNSYEGNRVKLGFRTNQKFSNSWIIRGYGAYGFRDERFKYNLQLERIITRYPWSKAGIQYRDDIDQIGLNYDFSRSMNLGQSPNYLYNTFSQIGNVSKLVRKKESRIWYEKDFNKGFSGKITFQNIKTTPLFPVTFGDQFNIFQQRNYSISEILFDTRISVKERFLQNGTERISLGNNKSPIININYTLGIKHLFDGDFNYSKASISLSNRIRTAALGYSQVFLKVGKVFSQIPYTLLEIPRGNETNVMASNTFNQMNYFEFVSDQYLEAFWQHHLSGLIFNRIPLIKKLNLREIVGLNMVYGTLTEKNRTFNSNNNFAVIDDVPYFEGDMGIENILDVIRVDFLYRLTYNDDFYKADYARVNQGSVINNWGVKVGLSFAF